MTALGLLTRYGLSAAPESGPAVTLVSHQHVAVAGSTESSKSVPKPTGVANGDTLIAVVSHRGQGSNTTVTPPPGFTAQIDADNASASGVRLLVYTKPVTDASNEPLNYSFTLSTGRYVAASVLCVRGANPAAPVRDSAVSTFSSGATVFPSVNGGAGDLLLVLMGAASSMASQAADPGPFGAAALYGPGSTFSHDHAAWSRNLITGGPTGTATTNTWNQQRYAATVTIKAP